MSRIDGMTTIANRLVQGLDRIGVVNIQIIIVAE